MTTASRSPATKMQSLSLRTAMLNNSALQIAVGEMHSLVSGEREHRESKKWSIDINAECSQAPRGTPSSKCSSAMWNLGAVHRPLHATRNAPTTRPALHEFAVLHKPSKRARTWCWLTEIYGTIGASCHWPWRCEGYHHFGVSRRQHLVASCGRAGFSSSAGCP